MNTKLLKENSLKTNLDIFLIRHKIEKNLRRGISSDSLYVSLNTLERSLAQPIPIVQGCTDYPLGWHDDLNTQKAPDTL